MIPWLLRLWHCRIWRWHDWTSAVRQDMLPAVIQVDQLTPLNIAQKFNYSARMWCRRCGRFSQLNADKSTAPVPGCDPWKSALKA
jgi:hypothetical protein